MGDGPVFLSLDVDALDPAFALGAARREPGGMTTIDLLWAWRTVGAGALVVGADVVEFCPTGAGSLDVTALARRAIVRELMPGIALRRRAS